MKIKKRIFSLALAGALTMGLLPVFSSPALAAEGDSSYTLTIPSTLTVANSGWNATDGISAAGTLDSGKKLSVTASSANSWALKSGDNSVGYNLATATGTYSSTAQPASWEFTALSDTAATKPMGIIVEDYSSNPAGTYQDTVTFTAKVENAVRTVKWDNMISMDMNINSGSDSETLNGVTVTVTSSGEPMDFGEEISTHGSGYFTFSSSEGKISKIVITHTGRSNWRNANTGWPSSRYRTYEGGTFTWSGTPAESVTLSGDGGSNLNEVTSIEFTIE